MIKKIANNHNYEFICKLHNLFAIRDFLVIMLIKFLWRQIQARIPCLRRLNMELLSMLKLEIPLRWLDVTVLLHHYSFPSLSRHGCSEANRWAKSRVPVQARSGHKMSGCHQLWICTESFEYLRSVLRARPNLLTANVIRIHINTYVHANQQNVQSMWTTIISNNKTHKRMRLWFPGCESCVCCAHCASVLIVVHQSDFRQAARWLERNPARVVTARKTTAKWTAVPSSRSWAAEVAAEGASPGIEGENL